LELRLFLFNFGFDVGYFVTFLDADVAVLSLLLFYLTDLCFEVCDEVLKGLLFFVLL